MIEDEKKISEDEIEIKHCDCGCEDGCDCDCDDDCECDDDECECGCGDDVVELFDEEGKPYKFYHIGGTQYDGKWYVCFMPAEEVDGVDSEEIVIFEASEDENGKEALLPIKDDKLLEIVFQKFCNEMEEELDAEDANAVDGGCHCHECECDDECGEDDCDCGCGNHSCHNKEDKKD